jgi:hypothetical protein
LKEHIFIYQYTRLVEQLTKTECRQWLLSENQREDSK